MVKLKYMEGLAGIGKSTIARTVVKEAHKHGWLDASIFFSRSEDDRKSAKLFFGSVAFQLSEYSKEISLCIGEALELRPSASGKQLQNQLWDLIIKPLQNCENKPTILIVIDTFDECDKQDADQLLSLLLQEIHKVPNLKIFFTMRSEQHILNILCHHEAHHLYQLHDIENLIVKGDVRSYLNYGLSPEVVRTALPELELPPWKPSLSDFNALANAVGKLFIVASTIIKFLLDDIQCNPKAQMADLMWGIAVNNTGANPLNMLDGFYTQILSVTIFPFRP